MISGEKKQTKEQKKKNLIKGKREGEETFGHN